MFLEEKDYKVVCTDEVLEIVSQSDPETRARAELSAREEAEGYLRARYDTRRAFAQQGAWLLSHESPPVSGLFKWQQAVTTSPRS